MQYLNDVYVNWIDNQENPQFVYYFHEWKKDDTVTLLDKIPIVKVNTNLFNYLIYDLRQLNEHFLNYIENRTFHRQGTERIQEQFGFIVTDSKDVMAIILNEDGYVHKKSRLIPRQHQLTLECASLLKNNYELDNHIDVSGYVKYEGLTRNERCLMVKIEDFIDTLTTKNLSLIKYLLSEINLDLHKKLLHRSFEEIKGELLEEIKVSDMKNLIAFGKVIDKIKVIN